MMDVAAGAPTVLGLLYSVSHLVFVVVKDEMSRWWKTASGGKLLADVV
jgi:hypothetical protein